MTVSCMGQPQKADRSLLRRTDPQGRGESRPDGRPEPFHDAEGEPLVCRRCGQQITSTSQRISVDSAHEHTFTNPEGIQFHIGCFGHVRGCLFSGEPTDHWSWFNGYQWSVAYCSECTLHLGWRFSSNEQIFHGLVLRNLVRLS